MICELLLLVVPGGSNNDMISMPVLIGSLRMQAKRHLGKGRVVRGTNTFATIVLPG